MRICFVCLGNICRSPTAEAVMRALAPHHTIESAGTGGWHVGEHADPRTSAAAARRGYDLSGHRARQFVASDFDRFELVVAMDRSNLRDLERLATGKTATIRLLRSYEPEPETIDALDVPDPYSGGSDMFERVLDICERSCRGLLDELAARR